MQNPYLDGRGPLSFDRLDLTWVGNGFDQTSPVVDLSQAPNVTSCGFIVGCSIFQPYKFGFGSVSGTVTFGGNGTQTITLKGPLTSTINRTVSFG